MSVRFAREADIPAILRIYAPYVENTAVSFEYTVPTTEEFTERFRAITARFPWLIWEADGQILGYAYGSTPFGRAAYQWCAEASIYLHPDARRRGIGRALYTSLEEYLRAQGFQVVYALVTSANEASMAFHRRMGYTPCAHFTDCGFKHGRWYSVTWLEKRLKPVEMPIMPPIPASVFVENDRNF